MVNLLAHGKSILSNTALNVERQVMAFKVMTSGVSKYVILGVPEYCTHSKQRGYVRLMLHGETMRVHMRLRMFFDCLHDNMMCTFICIKILFE